jgi:hypothetical protein
MLNDSVVIEEKRIQAKNTAQQYFALAHSYIISKKYH